MRRNRNHTFRQDIAYPDGSPRTEQAWAEAAACMVALFGRASGFPVIAPGRDPAATAGWLTRSLPAAPPGPQALPPDLAGRAEIREYALPEPGDLPHDVAIHEGQVIITGMFTATRRFRGYALPSPDQLVRHLVIDEATGDVWLAPGASPGAVPARVVRLRPLD